MRNCLLLLRVQLLQFFKWNQLRHPKSEGASDRSVWMVFLFAIVAIMMVVYSFLLSFGLVSLGLTDLLPPFLLCAAALTTLIATLLKSNGLLFGFRDYDMVMSLPVSTASILVSRLIVVYLTDLLFCAVVLVPGFLVYGFTLQIAVSGWLMLFLGLILSPLLPLILGAFLSIVVSAVAARFRFKNLVSVFLSVLMILGVFAASFSLQTASPESLSALSVTVTNLFRKLYPPGILFEQAVSQGHWTSFGLFALLSVGIFALVVFLCSRVYAQLNSALANHRTKGHYRLAALKTATPFRALLQKEFRRLLSCPVYLLNTVIGAIFLVVVGVAMLFVDLSDYGALLPFLRQYAPLAVSFFIGMSSTTSCSLSLEGKSRWLLFSAPVEPKTVYRAKIAANLLVLLPPVAFSCTVLAWRLQTSVFETLPLYILPVSFTFFTAVFGMVCNVKYPKYDWATENNAVKQSASVMLSVFGGMGVVLAALILSILLGQAGLLTAGGLLLLLTFLLYRSLEKKPLFQS